jgi:hypothetical protein
MYSAKMLLLRIPRKSNGKSHIILEIISLTGVSRMQAEHPPEESETVVCDRGIGRRTLGTDETTRSFGDMGYKRSAGEKEL